MQDMREGSSVKLMTFNSHLVCHSLLGFSSFALSAHLSGGEVGGEQAPCILTAGTFISRQASI